MLKAKILNKTKFDVVVDLGGKNDVKDKVIIPPKVTIEATIPNKMRSALKSDSRLDVTIIR